MTSSWKRCCSDERRVVEGEWAVCVCVSVCVCE